MKKLIVGVVVVLLAVLSLSVAILWIKDPVWQWVAWLVFAISGTLDVAMWSKPLFAYCTKESQKAKLISAVVLFALALPLTMAADAGQKAHATWAGAALLGMVTCFVVGASLFCRWLEAKFKIL